LGKNIAILSQVIAAKVSLKHPAVSITNRIFLSDSGIASFCEKKIVDNIVIDILKENYRQKKII
jgi:hypothetical protein